VITRTGMGIRRSVLSVLVAGLLCTVLLSSCTQSKAAPLSTVKASSQTVSVDNGHGEFKPLTGSAPIQQGRTIKTDASGAAEITYFDGSVTRLGASTTYTVTQLAKRDGSRQIVGRLEVGDSWHKVARATGSGSRFDVRTTNAVAAVRGTAFAVFTHPDGTSSLVVVDGVVLTTGKDGQAKPVKAGQAVTVAADGTVSAPREPTAEENAFAAGNAKQDGLDATVLSFTEERTTASTGVVYPPQP
jgi:hypothetical protein